jgi:nitrile hydratase
MHPADYMLMPYYSIWIKAAIRLMIERGMITEHEIATGQPVTPHSPMKRKLVAADVVKALAAGGPVDRAEEGHPLFAVGDRIITINNHPAGHTRMARYARDKLGVITKIHGFHVYPDSNAAGLGEDPKWLYQVTFASRTLWGNQGNDIDTVSLDLWEPYLGAAI